MRHLRPPGVAGEEGGNNLPTILDYDVTDVEESGGGTGVKAKPGVKVAKIMQAQHRTEKNDGSPANDIRLALNVGADFDWVFTYVGLNDASDWKLKQLIRAIGKKDKGKLNLEKDVEGKIIRVKLNPDSYEGEPTVKEAGLFPPQPGDSEEDLGGSVSESSTAKPVGPDEDDAAATTSEYPDGYDPVREDENDEEVGKYEDWPEEDLLGEVEDRGLTMPGGRGAKSKKAIEALRADDEAAGSPAEAGGEATDEAPEDEYDSWDLEQLKQEWTDRQLDDLPAIKGRGAADRMKVAIIEGLRQDDVENPFTP
jgi:hypothetical protein